MAKQYDLLVKLLLIGDSGVGKTCLACRYADGVYSQKRETVGIDFKMKAITMGGKKVRLQLWDTAGQERYDTITKQYFRRAQGIFLIYDITRETSFRHLDKWLKYVEECAAEDVILMLLANKSDAHDTRQVSKERGQEFAKKLNIPFYETSAKDASNITQAFLQMANQVLRQNKGEFDRIHLARADSDGEEYVSELLRQKSSSDSCCT